MRRIVFRSGDTISAPTICTWQRRAGFCAACHAGTDGDGDDAVQDDIVRLLEMEHAERLVTGFNRPNVFLQVLNATDVKAKLRLTREFLA